MKFKQASLAHRFTNSSKAGSDGKAFANHDYLSAKPVQLADDERSTKTEKTVESNEQPSFPDTSNEYPTFLTRIHVDTQDDTSFLKEVKKYKAKHIWEACKIGDEEAVRETIANSPDMIHRQEYGRTPLFLAAICGHIEIVKLLLDAGARDVDGTAYASASGACREVLKEYPKEPPRNPPKASRFLPVFSGYKKTKKKEPDDNEDEDEAPYHLHPLQRESLERLQTISKQFLEDANLSQNEDDSSASDDNSSVSTSGQKDEISVSSFHSEYTSDTSQNDKWDFCGGGLSASVVDMATTEKIAYEDDEESDDAESCEDTLTRSIRSERNIESTAVFETDPSMQTQGTQENTMRVCWKQRVKALRTRRLRNTGAPIEPMALIPERETEKAPATLKGESVDDFHQGTSHMEKDKMYLKEGDEVTESDDTTEVVSEEILTSEDQQNSSEGDYTDTEVQYSSGKNGFHRLKSHTKKKLITPAALLLGAAASGLSASLARKSNNSKKRDMDDDASPNKTATVSENTPSFFHEYEGDDDENAGYPSDEEETLERKPEKGKSGKSKMLKLKRAGKILVPASLLAALAARRRNRKEEDTKFNLFHDSPEEDLPVEGVEFSLSDHERAVLLRNEQGAMKVVRFVLPEDTEDERLEGTDKTCGAFSAGNTVSGVAGFKFLSSGEIRRLCSEEEAAWEILSVENPEDDEDENGKSDEEDDDESISSDPCPRSMDTRILQRFESNVVAPEDETENDDIAVATPPPEEIGLESDAFEKMVAERSLKLLEDDQWRTRREGWPDEVDDSLDENEFTEEERTSGTSYDSVGVDDDSVDVDDDSVGVDDGSDYVDDDSDFVGNESDYVGNESDCVDDDSDDIDDDDSDEQDEEPFQYYENPLQEIKSAVSELSFSLITEEIGRLFTNAEDEDTSDDE